MTDDGIFERLARHEERVDVPIGFADALLEVLDAERSRRRGPARATLLLVAALLLALAVAAAAIGGALLRPDPDAPVFGAVDCARVGPRYLETGSVLRVQIHPTYDAGAAFWLLTLYDDGVVTREPDWAPNFREAARLTSEGKAAVLGAVSDSGLAMGGCHLDFATDGPVYRVQLRMADGTEAQTDWGSYGPAPFFRVMSGAERTAAEDLAWKLEQLDAWLAPTAWMTGWAPSAPDGPTGLSSSTPGDVPSPSDAATDPCAGLQGYLGHHSQRDNTMSPYDLCDFGRGEDSYYVFVRRAPVGDLRPELLAYSWLGPDAIESTIAGVRVWENGCTTLPSMDPYCSPGFAVVADDRFIVLHRALDPALVRDLVPMIVARFAGG